MNSDGNRQKPRQAHNRQQNPGHPLLHPFSGHEFEQLGLSIMGGLNHNVSASTRERRFISHFGLSPHLICIVWRELIASGVLELAGRRPKPEHLLWCLLFLRNYNKEEINANLVGASERTFRDWVWFYAEGIANLDRKFVRPYTFFAICC